MLAGCEGGGKPTINSISPASGPPMAQILIYGSGFGKGGGKTKVEFNGKAIGVKTWSETEIVATVPTGTEPGKYKVTVVTEKETSQPLEFEVSGDSSSNQSSGAKTQKDLIIEYATENKMIHPGENFRGYAIENVAIFTSSKTDPTWELWTMPTDESEEPDYFLLHKEGDKWKVVKGGFYNNVPPQQYGAPADITIPPSQE